MNENIIPRKGRHAEFRNRRTKRTKITAMSCATRSTYQINVSIYLTSTCGKRPPYTNPKHLRLPRHTRKRIPHPRQKTPRCNGTNPHQIRPQPNIMHRPRMTTKNMIKRRKRKTNHSPQKEQPKHNPIINISGGIVCFSVRVEK